MAKTNAIARPPAASDRHALRGAISPWLKAPYTVFAGAMIPLLALPVEAGPGQPPWFSDIVLIATVAALWYEQRLLASMMALAVLLPALVWHAGFWSRLVGNVDPFGIASPAFDPSSPVSVRALALYYFVVPPLLLWLVHRLGYDPRALRAQTLVGWTVLIFGYLLASEPLVDGSLAAGAHLAQAWLPAWLWLLVLLVAYPVLVYLPAHLLLRAALVTGFGRRARRAPTSAGTPGRARQARLRDFVDLALVRARRRR